MKKTDKMYVGGKFPRTESGRHYELHDKKGRLLANVSQGSRKDFREAVVAARKAQDGWAKYSAGLKGQIFCRISEMLEGRSEPARSRGRTHRWPRGLARDVSTFSHVGCR